MSHRWRRAAVVGMALILMLGLGFWHQAHLDKPQQPERLLISKNKLVKVPSFAAAATGAGVSSKRPQVIRIGIEISNIYNVELAKQTFMANGYFWLQWPETVQQWMEDRDIEPVELIDFPNNIVSYDFLVEPTLKKPNVLANGTREQAFRFSGHFWTEELDFNQFPFQTMKIPIRFEIAPEDFALNGPMPTSLVADPDQADLTGSLIEIPGLEFQGARLDPFLHRFADDTSFSTGNISKFFSQVRLLTVFKTHPVTAIGQWLLPILIVMLTVFIGPAVTGRLSDVRIAIPSAALLTLVVMQQSYETTIPQLSYLTFLDLIYLWCYGITAALFILFVWSANQCASIDSDDPDYVQQLGATTARIKRMDRRFQLLSLLGTTLFMSWAFLR
jgi:hypothetical protein